AIASSDLVELQKKFEAVLAMLDVLGLSSIATDQAADNGSTHALETLVQTRLQERQQARTEKNWARSDEIRDELAEAGIKIEDSSNGATWSIERKQQR
ncbi:cysteine--tRNA ligase, partial [Vibrio vulnificus]